MDKSFGTDSAFIDNKQNQKMNIFRFANFYSIGRNISPDYIFCASLYKLDRNVLTKVRAITQQSREIYTSNNRTEDLCSNTVGTEQKKILPKNEARMLHVTPKQHISVDEVTNQVVTMFRSIRMQDLKDAPQPIFWLSAASLIPLLAPPLTFMVFGYSRFLSSAELYYAAALCSFTGGVKWGYDLHDNDYTWGNYGLSVIPQLFSWFTIMLPNALGYLVIIPGLMISAYVDLTMGSFPSWYRAIRLAVTTFALIGLTMAFLMSIFN